MYERDVALGVTHRIQKEGRLRSLAPCGPVDTGVFSTLYILACPEYSYNPHSDRPPRAAGVGSTASAASFAISLRFTPHADSYAITYGAIT